MTAQLLPVKFIKSTYGGSALGHVIDPASGSGQQSVFVPYVFPGETARVRVVEEKRGYLRAEVVELLTASPERITPRCRHFGICGGCHYQHMSYPAQLVAKTGILCDQLQRIGHIDPASVKPMVACSREWHYRNHVQFHLTQQGKLGFMRGGEKRVLEISECHLPEIELETLWSSFQFDPGLDLKRISLRLGVDDSLMVVLESESPETPELDIEAELSVVHLTGSDPVVIAGDEHLLMQVNGRLFRVSAASFFQVNTEMAGKMVEHLLDRVQLTPGAVVLDAYCGVGLFSAFLAPRVKRLIGIEVSPSACQDYAANLDDFENVELYESPVEDALPALDIHPELVILDPPRAGMRAQALDALVKMSPDTVAYISCDPATLSRDASRLTKNGYKLVEVIPFDLFPQTYHIESFSLFEK